MDYFVVFVLGMVAAVLILRWAVNRAIDRIVSKIDRELSDSTETDIGIQLKVEFDQNMYFMYNAVNSTFVCQAPTVEQLYRRLQQMFPNQTATIVEGDPELLVAIQQELANIK
jgi:hypothetical protein